MAMAKKKAPKSRKADGTPKKRWSAAERATRGHGPRHRGGESRTGRGEPTAGSGRWSDRTAGDDRAPRDDRPARASWGRDERPARRDERVSRDDRPARPAWGRDERPARRDERVSRDDRPARRDDRFSRDERPARKPWERDERSSGSDRPARKAWGRDERPARGEDRFSRDERPARKPWERDERSSGSDRPARKAWGRDERPARGDDRFSRDERPARKPWERDERSSGSDRPARKAWGRDERPARGDDRFSRDERPARKSWDRDERPARSGAWGRDERPAKRWDRDDRAPRTGGGEHRSEFESEADQMSWTATEAGDVEVTEADQTSDFAGLGVALPLVAVLKKQGIEHPFAIQSATIADAIAGRDVLGRGRTGSGKTFAFGLPLLTRLSQGRPVGAPRAMILTPTRELALQIADNLSPLAASVGLKLTLIAGGMSYGPQLKAFERGVDIVVATPGRLIDLLEQGAADLSQVEVTVLDEADHMSDLGFLPAVQTLLDATPAENQKLLFSATLDDAVARVVRTYLHNPVTHEVDSSQASVTTMTHHVLELAPHHKNGITAEIANREGKTLVFARTQMGADRIAGQLREAGVMAGALHGGLTQGARARVLEAFKGEECPVLVATDVAARGIHVDDVTLVLQVDPPMGPKDYLHRAGRTARAGEEGSVVSLVLPHQRKQMRRITGQAGVRIAPLDVTPGSDKLRGATGARPVEGQPIPEQDYQRLIAPKPQQRKRPGGAAGRGGGYRGGRPRGRW